MSPDAGLFDLVYVGAFLGSIVLLAALWCVGALTAQGRRGRSTVRWTIGASVARGRSVAPMGPAGGDGGGAGTARHGDARSARMTRDAVPPGP
jgi:hypothetical protein